MARIDCEREQDVVDAVNARRWPGRTDGELRAHIEECAVCRDVAAVAAAVREDHDTVWPAAHVPSAAHVWWRAQIRARHEAAAAASRPITMAQGLAAASAVGLGIAAIGYGWAQGMTASWPGAFASSGGYRVAEVLSDFALLVENVPAFGLLLAAALTGLVLMPLALYLVLSEK